MAEASVDLGAKIKQAGSCNAMRRRAPDKPWKFFAGASWKPPAACVVSGLMALTTVASPCWSAEPNARNQASIADTVILPPHDGNVEDERSSAAFLLQALGKLGLKRLDHLGIVDAAVDADGCMAPPLVAQSPDGHSPALELLADMLRRRGVVVTVIPGNAVQSIDAADQKRVHALKGAFNLSFSDGPGRWFATKAQMIACAKVDPDDGRATGKAHAPLAAMLAALHQDAVLAVGESEAQSKGATWNIIEGELSGSGKNLDAAQSSAKIAAMLVLKDGSTPWSGEANAEGSLRPPLDAQAVARLKAYMEDEMRKLEAYRTAHPGADQPPDNITHGAFNAIASGDLDESPKGSTLGPSAYGTLQAAAGRLVDRLQPALPGK